MLQSLAVVVVVAVLAAGPLSEARAAQPPQPAPPGAPAPGVPGQPMPPRTTPARPGEAPATGTAILRGFVVAADTGEPVRRAIVRAQSPAGGGVTSTDEDGRFEVRDLPANRYSLSASKGGYVSIQYGQRQPRQAGTPIELRDGEIVEKIQLALPPGSVITGRIFDDFGDPVSGVVVSALQYRSIGGVRQLAGGFGEGANARTDDQGSFRIYGLAPGDYFVSAAPPNTMNAPGLRDDTPGGVPTYYPGVVSPAEAAQVRVQLGQETAGITFPIVIARMARISGRIVNARGAPARNAMVRIESDAVGLEGVRMMRGAPTGQDGAFNIANVPPGEYRLHVQLVTAAGLGSEAASVPVSVGAGDVEDLLINTMAGGVARGRVVLDTGGVPPFEADAVRVSLTPLRAGMLMSSPTVSVESDWTFEATGLFEPRLVRAGLGTPDWTLKAVRLDGRDVTDEPIDFGPGRTVEGIEIELTDKVTNLEGTVTDERGQPVLDATLIVFSADSGLWTRFSRFLRSARPDQAGYFQIRNLPPHRDYRLVAVTNVDDDDLRDPEFLASVRDAAVRFSLAEGERRVENLRVRPD